MEIIDKILDCMYGIWFLVMGGIVLFLPYDKYKKLFPKAPSKKAVKILGMVVIVCGIVMLVLQIMF